MSHDLSAVRLLAAVACRAGDEVVDARRAAVTDEPRLIEIAGMLGLTLALDAKAEALNLALPARRHLVASAMVVSLARDAALRLLADLHAAGVPSGRAVVIKGGALSLAWPALAHRVVSDVDVVVPQDDVEPWLQAAARLGAQVTRTIGYEAAYFTRDRGMLELHLALPGFAGNDAGPDWTALHPRSTPIAGQPWLMPVAPVAREIAVQHFLFHHGGEAAHALRTIQDLSLLEDSGEGPGLDWGTPAVARATERMRHIARSIRAGHDDDAAASDFLVGLTSILGETTARSFAEESRQWIQTKPGLSGKLALLARRLIPPVSEMRKAPDESRLTIATRYARRPLELIRKYRAAAHTDRRRTAALRQWREEVARLGR